MFKIVSRIGFLGMLAVVGLGVSPVAAQNNGPVDIPIVSEFGGPGGLPDGVDAFGTNQQWQFLHAPQWTPWGNPAGGIGYFGGTGYIYPLASGDDFWAQLTLPVGAQINWIHWYVYDNDATCYWYMTFGRYEGSDGSASPVWQQIVLEQTDSAGTPGYVRINTNLTGSPPMIGSWEDINTDGNLNYTSYAVQAELIGCGGGSGMRLYGTGFNWSRVISPAPAVQTFPDVAPGFWAFQEIEALAASGITTGFPDGTFKPTANVTRAQMATFLARALGLHWPY